MNGLSMMLIRGLLPIPCKSPSFFSMRSGVLVRVCCASSNIFLYVMIVCWYRFPSVVDALNSANGPVYIITTKQTRFCLLLLQRNGVSSVPAENVFGLGSGTKISILKKIIAMPENKGRKVMFVEDRYETLEAVSLSMLGQPLELHLAAWGYNTEKTRNVAKRHPFISLLELDSFVTKLQ